ncbi:MAG: hypothetical protein ACOCNT_00385 [Bacteroidales bacterium]
MQKLFARGQNKCATYALLCCKTNKTMPMPHFTPNTSSPKEKTLNFIKAFARLYVPGTTSEQDARLAAAMFAQQTATC